jgi:hypothetical protein
MITHAGIRDQIALATDPAIIEQLQDKILYLNFARLMLVGLFLFISSLVYFAFLKDGERAGLQYKILKHNSNEYRSINNNGIDAGNRNFSCSIFSIRY